MTKIRTASPDDRDFLQQMFLGAFFWQGDAPARLDAGTTAAMEPYVADWGRQGDAALVALSESDDRLGAAWYRLFSEQRPGYGFVSPDIPELGIAVVKASRNQGVGRRLMESLIEAATAEGHPALSLSVEDGNARAAHLYESIGFKTIGRNGDANTMLLELRSKG